MPGAIAEDRCGWTPGWTEIHSHSYGLKEAQVQACMDKPGPEYWSHVLAHSSLAFFKSLFQIVDVEAALEKTTVP